jgi:hypothetical protein
MCAWICEQACGIVSIEKSLPDEAPLVFGSPANLTAAKIVEGWRLLTGAAITSGPVLAI